MKAKIFFLLAAIMLSCTSAFAQSGNSDPLKGDVNGDGVVDVADIAAIIEIMKNGGGIVDNNYYWYVGQEIPTEISGIADYENGGGWTSTGNSVPDTINKLVKGFDRNKEIFVLVPITEGTTLKPVMSDLSTIDTAVQEVEEKILNNVNYKVYNYGSDSIRKTIMLVKK